MRYAAGSYNFIKCMVDPSSFFSSNTEKLVYKYSNGLLGELLSLLEF